MPEQHGSPNSGPLSDTGRENITRPDASSQSGPAYTRPVDIPASPLESGPQIPGATPPSTMTELLANGSSIIGPNGNTLSSQIDPFSGRRGLSRNELADGSRDEQGISELDAGSGVLNRNATGFTNGVRALPRELDQLSMAASNPHLSQRGLQAISEDGIGPSPGERVRVIWGTNIVISDAIAAFRSFITEFTPAHRKLSDAREHGEGVALPGTSAHDLEPLYPRLLQQVLLPPHPH